jgi:hypothetical protein
MLDNHPVFGVCCGGRDPVLWVVALLNVHLRVLRSDERGTECSALIVTFAFTMSATFSAVIGFCRLDRGASFSMPPTPVSR